MIRRWSLPLACLAAACGEGELYVRDTTAPPQPAAPFAGDPDHRALYAVDVGEEAGPLSQAELDCLWESGVRHLVVLTGLEVVARQQLQLGALRGFTVDAVVRLPPSAEPRAQVREALRRVEGLPIGRLWLEPSGTWGVAPDAGVWLSRLGEALDECTRASRAGCGLFTDADTWRAQASGSERFSEAPLWYPRHDGARLLWAWVDDQFGGWVHPAGKQWGYGELCTAPMGFDTLQRVSSPSVVVDRSPAPPPGGPPPAPGGMWPTDGARLPLQALKLMVETVPHATRYDHALERLTQGAWMPYVTWRSAAPFKRLTEVVGTKFRYRARAENAYGWGPFSAWQTFELEAVPQAPDAGAAAVDAGRPDAGPLGLDAGPLAGPPGLDGGRPDGGTPPPDAGPPRFDAGSPRFDAGSAPGDAGFPPGDAGVAGFDAGPGALDAGARDAGNPSPDAGRPDAGAPAFDAGRSDAGAAPLDAGGYDAGGYDAGGYDAGGYDAGGYDAGATDAGPRPTLMPDQNATFTVFSAVTLSVSGLSGTQFEFSVEWLDAGGVWGPYFTYTAALPSKTFYPQFVGSYRFRVRAFAAGAFGPPTAYATFRAL